MEFIVSSIEKAIEVPLDEAFGFFFVTLCGVLVSWIYKCKREGIKLSSYWLENVWSSLGVFGAAIAGFLVMIITEPGVSKITYFAIGLAADSMLNKPPLPIAVREALAKIEAVQNENNVSPGIIVPPGVYKPDDTQAAIDHAIDKIGRNYVAGQSTAAPDAPSDPK